MTEYATGYQPISSYCDEDPPGDIQHGDGDVEGPPSENIVHVVPDKSRARWNHIEDLDEFFSRVYQYHQRSGFMCMVLQDFLQLLQFLFIVVFSTFLIKCVDYPTLFYEREYNHTHKVTIAESVFSAEECFARFDAGIVICITIALLFWFLRFLKVLYNVFKYYEMRSFYTGALKISSSELLNVTWHEVQLQLMEVQKEQQMCIHKQQLTQLDIYHRILRFKNYMVAMVNKDLLPLKYNVPFMGECVFLTTGLKYNLEMLFFWGPWAPFENNWHLRSEYRNHHKRLDLAHTLSRRILWVGLANLLLSPVIFLWQILYSFFRYAEVLKREPGSLGSRRWSLYARLYLRHFNELDHEFNARLCRAYKPAEKYMNIFTSPVVVLFAKHIAFFAGSILAVLVILTMVDEDVLSVQHVLVTMTTAGIVVTICGACIPDEHMVWCPEMLLRSVLGHIHYMPDGWRGQAHTHDTRAQFAQYFQYKVVYLLEELLSPLLTPLILIFSIRHKALAIVDFYRNFTVEVTGVGDVCSFAQMDIRKHGNPTWTEDEQTDAGLYEQAEHGKTELSLMHFTLTNPEWKPRRAETDFLKTLRKHAQRDADTLHLLPQDNPLANSLSSINYAAPGYTSLLSSVTHQSHLHHATSPGSLLSPAAPTTHSPDETTPPDSGPHSIFPVSDSGSGMDSTPTDAIQPPLPMRPLPPAPVAAVRGGLRGTEGPLGGSGTGLLASIHQTNPNVASFCSMTQAPDSHGRVREDVLEYLSSEMSFSALYMHELHHRKKTQPFFSREDSTDLWPLTQPQGGTTGSSGGNQGKQKPGPSFPNPRMPNIEEDEVELENVPIRGIWQSGEMSQAGPVTATASLTTDNVAPVWSHQSGSLTETSSGHGQSERAPLLPLSGDSSQTSHKPS